ncbi:MAG: biopolymer transporter ExbD [Pseudomonadota bacterium]|nr:biopolymer transporter ExbD [Pseudomonadota bacterium]
MMIMETSSRRPPLEPVLPLINVVFLLLIFFMLAGQLAKRPSVSVDTPLSQSANGPEAREKLLLVLQKDGQWFVEDSDTPLSDKTLQERLDAYATAEEDIEVRLLADAAISMTTLRERLETLQAMGVKQVRLVTRNDGGGE